MKRLPACLATLALALASAAIGTATSRWPPDHVVLSSASDDTVESR